MMNSDIEQISILYDLVTQFKIKKTIVDELIQQIDNKEYSDNLNRFFNGFSFEDHFNKLFSGFPCVIGITGFKQKQSKSYKLTYQVPDYVIIVQNISNKPIPLLIDVKSVNKNKAKCELLAKQVTGLVNYSKTLGINMLISIYWSNKYCWTLNSINHFNLKGKKYCITFEEAYKENVSHILGDFTYLFDKAFSRQRNYRKTERIKLTGNIEYGELEEVSLIFENNNCISANTMDSAIIDSILPISNQIVTKKNDLTIVRDSFLGDPIIIKLDYIVMSLLATTNKRVDDYVGDINIVDFTVSYIIDFVEKFNIKRVYNIPDIKTPDMESIFDLVYENTTVNIMLKQQKEKII